MERDRRSAATALLWPEPPPALTLAGRPTPMSDVVPAPTLSELKPLKPLMRGWLHAGMAPLVLVAGVVLIGLSPTAVTQAGATVFTVCSLTLFTSSATMHLRTGRWSPRAALLLKRLAHSSIYLLIAGTCTPVSILLLDGARQTAMLALAWGGTAVGIAFRVWWTEAPRWLYTLLYILLGWTTVAFAGDFAHHARPGVLVLLAAGGVLYTLGGVVYGLRRPNPFPSSSGSTRSSTPSPCSRSSRTSPGSWCPPPRCADVTPRGPPPPRRRPGTPAPPASRRRSATGPGRGWDWRRCRRRGSRHS